MMVLAIWAGVGLACLGEMLNIMCTKTRSKYDWNTKIESSRKRHLGLHHNLLYIHPFKFTIDQLCVHRQYMYQDVYIKPEHFNKF